MPGLHRSGSRICTKRIDPASPKAWKIRKMPEIKRKSTRYNDKDSTNSGLSYRMNPKPQIANRSGLCTFASGFRYPVSCILAFFRVVASSQILPHALQQEPFSRNADAKLIKIFAFYKKVVSLPSKIKSAVVLCRTANSE